MRLMTKFVTFINSMNSKKKTKPLSILMKPSLKLSILHSAILLYVLSLASEINLKKKTIKLYFNKFSSHVTTLQKAPMAHRKWSQEQYKISGIKINIILSTEKFNKFFLHLIYKNNNFFFHKFISVFFYKISFLFNSFFLNLVSIKQLEFYFKTTVPIKF